MHFVFATSYTMMQIIIQLQEHTISMWDPPALSSDQLVSRQSHIVRNVFCIPPIMNQTQTSSP